MKGDSHPTDRTASILDVALGEARAALPASTHVSRTRTRRDVPRTGFIVANSGNLAGRPEHDLVDIHAIGSGGGPGSARPLSQSR